MTAARDGRAGRAGRAAPGRHGGLLQRPLLPALPRGPGAHRRRAARARSTTSPAPTCRTGCCYDTDFNWRVLAEEGGALRAVADIGTHWLDLVTCDHRPGGRAGLRRPADVPAGAAPAEGLGRDVPGQARQRRARRSRSPSTPRTTARCCCASAAGRRGCLHRLAGDGRPEELPALRDRRRQAAPGLGQRAAQRAVARPPRPGQRAADPRPGPAARRRCGRSPTTPAATTRGSPTRSSSCSGPSTTTSTRATGRRRGRSRRSPTATARSCCARRSCRATANSAGF